MWKLIIAIMVIGSSLFIYASVRHMLWLRSLTPEERAEYDKAEDEDNRYW